MEMAELFVILCGSLLDDEIAFDKLDYSLKALRNEVIHSRSNNSIILSETISNRNIYNKLINNK